MFLSLHVLPKKLPANKSGRSLDMLSLRCLVTCVHYETWSDAQTPLKRTKSHICCQTRSHFSCLYKEANLTIIVCAFVQRWGCVKRKEVLETVGSVWVGPDAKLKYLACVSGVCKKKKQKKLPQTLLLFNRFLHKENFPERVPTIVLFTVVFFCTYSSLSLLFALPSSFIPSQPTKNLR